MSDRTLPLRSNLTPAEKADIMIRWKIRDTRKSLAEEYHCLPSLIESVVTDRNKRKRELRKAKKQST